MQTFRKEPTVAPRQNANAPKRKWYRASESPMTIESGAPFFSAHEPGDPDTTLVKETHRQRHRDHREDVGSWADDRCKDEHEDNGVRSRPGHEFIGDQTETDERQDRDGQLESDAERDREP